MTTSEETKVAVMQKEISYISKQVDTIVSKLDEATKSHQMQIERLQVEIDKRFDGVHARIDIKADQTEVDKINSTIERLAWFIILAVLGAILTVIFK